MRNFIVILLIFKLFVSTALASQCGNLFTGDDFTQLAVYLNVDIAEIESVSSSSQLNKELLNRIIGQLQKIRVDCTFIVACNVSDSVVATHHAIKRINELASDEKFEDKSYSILAKLSFELAGVLNGKPLSASSVTISNKFMQDGKTFRNFRTWLDAGMAFNGIKTYKEVGQLINYSEPNIHLHRSAKTISEHHLQLYATLFNVTIDALKAAIPSMKIGTRTKR